MANIQKELYNEALKKRFIDEAGLSKTKNDVALCMFGPACRFERAAGKDLYQMQPDELQSVIDEVFTGNILYKKSMFSVLKLYLEWCSVQGLPGAVCRTDGLNYFGLANVRRSMVADAGMLQNVLDSLFRPEFDGGLDVTFRAYYWLLFSGVTADEAVNLTANDIDFSRKTIHCCTGVDVMLRYPESMSSLMYCIMADHFVVYYDHGLQNKQPVTRKHERSDGDTILRGLARYENRTKEPSIDSRIADKMLVMRKQGGVEYKITTQSILRSGVFYRAYCEERATGESPDFSEWIDIAIRERKMKAKGGDEPKKMSSTNIRNLLHDTFIDYEIWKDAFGLK